MQIIVKYAVLCAKSVCFSNDFPIRRSLFMVEFACSPIRNPPNLPVDLERSGFVVFREGDNKAEHILGVFHGFCGVGAKFGD